MKKIKFDDKQDDLRAEYLKALKNPEFKALVNSLKLDSDILMYSTTRLLQVLHDKKASTINHDINNCPMDVPGFILNVRNEFDNLHFFYEDCPCRVMDEKMKNVLMFDVGSSLKNASFEDIYLDDKKRKPIIKFLVDFKSNINEKPKGAYLYGNFGSGKTYLIAALFNELAKDGISSVIVHTPEMLRGLKESFSTDYSERFNLLQTTPLLLLDDIGAEHLTAWARDEVLEPLINYRMNENLPTFYASNSTLKELEEHFKSPDNNATKAKRIMERIKFTTEHFELISENRR